MTVSEAVLSRRSVRAFRDRPVPTDVLERVLDKARWAPSGCNFQPWEATVLTGTPLRALQNKLAGAAPQEPVEYVITPPDIPQEYRDRLAQMGARQYGARGIDREDAEMRARAVADNVVSFGAPVLLLREEGLDSCPQEFMALWARLIKEHIGVSDEAQILFCGMAIGYRDEAAAVNNFERDRAPLSRQVRFIGFDEEGPQ